MCIRITMVTCNKQHLKLNSLKSQAALRLNLKYRDRDASFHMGVPIIFFKKCRPPFMSDKENFPLYRSPKALKQLLFF